MSVLTTLAADDLSRTDHFYRQLLGLSSEWLPVASEPRAALLVSSGRELLLFQECSRLMARHPAVLAGLDRYPRGLGVMLEFTLAALQPVRSRLETAEIPLLYELEDDEHQRSELWVRDPDGYLLILNQEAAPL